MGKEKPVKRQAICWDMDSTLGHFHQAYYEVNGEPLPEWEKPLSVQYGMEDLLQEFSEENGFVHYVTTSAPNENEYVDTALRRTGLAGYF